MDVVHDDGLTDRVITRAIGEELKRARAALGWTRDELVERIQSDLHPRTIATYEHGTRQCTIVRFVEICAGLGVAASQVLDLAQQRANLHLQTIGIHVDLRSIAADAGDELNLLKMWAANRIAADPNGTGTAHLTGPALREIAAFLSISRADLTRYLLKFTPESAPQRQHCPPCERATNSG